MIKEPFVFKLFVAGDERHSRQAAANLKRICETYLNNNYQIEIIDIFISFECAIENDIFFSPALVKVSPGPRMVIFGNLNDTTKTVHALQLEKS
jgi:circadian clock protein KaiB